MAGQIIISNIKTDSDNAFSILANTGAVLFSANLASGITTGIADGSVTNAKLAGSITGDKITVGSLAGNVFTANTITGDKIGQSAISSNNIVSVNASVATVGTLPTARLPSGTVLQVVSANTTTSTSTSSTSFVATNLAATITPISTSSKIFIIVAGGAIRAGSGNQIYMTVYRGATNLGNANRGLSQMNGNASNDYTPALSYYDGPATTSPTTYTVYVATASSTVNFEVDLVPCTMTLMEIAG